MPYFKIKYGYNIDDFVTIDNLRDLDRAHAAFRTNAKTIFENGEVIRGQDIVSGGITEDWWTEMGWNHTFRDDNGKVREYMLGDDDWADIRTKGVEKRYSGLIAESKARVEYLLDSNQTHLIGKNIDVIVPEQSKQLSQESKTLSDKFRI